MGHKHEEVTRDDVLCREKIEIDNVCVRLDDPALASGLSTGGSYLQ